MDEKKTKVNYSLSEDLNITPWGEFSVEFQSREAAAEGSDSEKDWNQEFTNRFKEALDHHFTPALLIPGTLGTVKYVLHKGEEAQLYFRLMTETMNAVRAEMEQETARLRKQAEDDLREAEKYKREEEKLKDFLRARENFENQ